MANGNTDPSRVGLIEGGSDNDALFLKKFSGEILQTLKSPMSLNHCTLFVPSSPVNQHSSL